MSKFLDDLTIDSYQARFREAFERLNLQWLEENSLLEAIDLDYLQDPERYILHPGGQVYCAHKADAVLGVCAAIRITPFCIELAKLAVDTQARGHGIGRRLCEHVIQFAVDSGATQVVLSSNKSLLTALHLYRSLGFQKTAIPSDIRYKSADIYMILNLNKHRC